jgi:hypothetical protein
MCALGASQAELPVTNQFKVVQQNANLIKLQFSSPNLKYENAPKTGWTSLQMAGAQGTAQDGYPVVPMFSTWVAIPAQGDFSISVKTSNEVTVEGIKPSPAFANESAERDWCSIPTHTAVRLHIL